ncbi:hypothetical protein PSECIP111854_00441 [Pseudoalteromonas sp. CIP111854]|uniref:Uncharacterized protein n=1 Tax=Pseudoalteromonas holothuriae TaxID=2963714 RepID=A0A9W4QRP5_9GAMM|nr:hypothetical protein [Pseudoalteromonas sp. CIP111854]CAH9049985.1 hypothetical protein PSECIP111854_00441 [Pseudoalteromonas sp. CIP111854]
MNEILYGLGWALNVVIFLVVIFWLQKFSKMRWKLFFGTRKDLVSVQHHELYSCFLTAFCFLIFHMMDSELEWFMLSLDMEKVEKIKLFYTSLIVLKFALLMTLFCFHLIRGCTFSPSARICTYVTLVFMMLLGMQLIARGYYDYHALNIVYIVGGWICNLIAIAALASYPVRSIKDHYKERRATAS